MRRTLKIWLPAATMMLLSLLSYVDRNTLALLAPTILEETKLTGEQYGWIISAFSVAYMLANPLWGRWLDRFGLRIGLTVSVVFWTMASVSHAFAAGFLSFAVARFALGFGEGATFPGGLRTVVLTLPVQLRARGVAVAFSGGALGAIITPLLITPVAVYFGWRGAFWFTGALGLAWLLLWTFVNRDERIGHKPPSSTAEAHKTPGLLDKRLWSFIFAYAFGSLPLGFVLYSASLYLRTLGKTQAQIGAVLWIPPLGWEVGYFFWGWLADRWMREFGLTIKSYRTLFGIALIFSLPLAFATMIHSFPLLLAEMFLAMFITAAFIILPISYGTHVFGPGNSGFIAGVGAGSWSALVAVVMPIIGRMFDKKMYTESFVLATLFPIAGYSIWLLLNRGEE